MKRLKPFLYILCGLYILVMLWLLFGQRIGEEHAGSYWQELRGIPIPFETVFRFGKIILTGEPAYLVPHAVQNLAGNVIMFMPIGFFLPCFFARCRSLKMTALFGLLIIAGIEFTQFFSLLGSLDFDDFMLNSIGICLGFAVWRLIVRKIGIDKCSR